MSVTATPRRQQRPCGTPDPYEELYDDRFSVYSLSLDNISRMVASALKGGIDSIRGLIMLTEALRHLAAWYYKGGGKHGHKPTKVREEEETDMDDEEAEEEERQTKTAPASEYDATDTSIAALMSRAKQRSRTKRQQQRATTPAKTLPAVAKASAESTTPRRSPSRSSKSHRRPTSADIGFKTLCCVGVNLCLMFLARALAHGVGALFQWWFAATAFAGEDSSQVGDKMVRFWHYFFHVCWILPSYVISRVVNVIFYQEVATAAFNKSGSRSRTMASVSVVVADNIGAIIVEFVFLMQGTLLSAALAAGRAGQLARFLHEALSYALYAFEYKWFSQGIPLDRRLRALEDHWPYFLGFGGPMAAVTTYACGHDLYSSGTAFACLFPVIILAATAAHVDRAPRNVSLALFGPSLCVTGLLSKGCRGLYDWWGSKRVVLEDEEGEGERFMTREEVERLQAEQIAREREAKIRFNKSL